jgi:plasmid stability protein
MATLTLRNVPDELVARLKARAKRHRRSLNNETIAALELADATATGVTPLSAAESVDLDDTLQRMEVIRAGLRAKAAAEGREILLLPPPPLLTPKQIQAQRQRFAVQRSGFKGPPPTSEEIIEAIERENHPPDDDLLATLKRLDY